MIAVAVLFIVAVIVQCWVIYKRCDQLRVQELRNCERCWQCGQKYIGLAQDCACTNWGE